MRLGFIDFEATGINPKTAQIIEYAFMLYDTELSQPLLMQSNFVRINEPLPKEIEELTGIHTKVLEEFGLPLLSAMLKLKPLMQKAEYLVAHNALEYDKVLYETECTRHAVPIGEHRWVDTMFDLPFPKHIRDRKLTHLATAHEFLNPMPHRALADVITLQKIFCKYDLKSILAINSTKLITVRADVAFNNKDLAKKRGYFWEPERKLWLKKMREIYLEGEIKESGFRVIVL